MTAKLDRIEWLWLAGLAFLTLVVGLTAGVNPGLAIGLATACAYALLAFTNLALALAIFCAEPQKLDFDESGMIRLGIVLLLIAWLGVVVSRDRAKRDFLSVHPAMSLVLGLFIGWTLLSATWAEEPDRAWNAAGGYAAGVAIILITFTAVQRRGTALMVAAIFVAGSAATLVLALLVGTAPTVDTGTRLASSQIDPNELAATLVAGAALSVGVAQFARGSPGLRLAAYGAGALCVFGIFLSVSRGGLIALGVMLTAAIVLGGRWRGRIALIAIAVVLSTVYYFAALAPDEARERVYRSTDTEAAQREGRSSIWQIGWRIVEANPVRGVGAGNFVPASRHYLLEPGAVWRSDQIINSPKVAHNTYLGFWAELGIVGLSLFVAVVIFSLRAALLAARNFARRGDRAGEALGRTLALGLIGMLTATFFLSHPYNKGMWLLFGLSAALLAISSRDEGRPSEGDVRR